VGCLQSHVISRLLDVLTLGPRRRRRRLDRQLAQLDRIDEIAFIGIRGAQRRTRGVSRGGSSVPSRHRARDRAIAVLALGLAGWWTFTQQLGWEIGLDGIARPGAARGEAGFAFSRTQAFDDTVPVAYSPCRQIPVVLNPQGAPEEAEGLVEEAVARVADLTGLDLVVAGETDERPSDGVRSESQPVLIAWSTPEEEPDLSGDVAGLGGSTSVRQGGAVAGLEQYVSGQIILDGPQLQEVMDRRGRDQVRAIILHELGHVVGLDHVEDPFQLMHAENLRTTDFAAGDRRGLRLLGQGPCRPGG
jgi:hypothetical protein